MPRTDRTENTIKMQKIDSIDSQYPLSSINVRSSPTISNNVISNMALFDATHTGGIEGNWYKIQNARNQVGYVHKSVVTIVPVKSDDMRERLIIDLHPDTVIIDKALHPILMNVLRNILDRVENAKPYEES